MSELCTEEPGPRSPLLAGGCDHPAQPGSGLGGASRGRALVIGQDCMSGPQVWGLLILVTKRLAVPWVTQAVQRPLGRGLSISGSTLAPAPGAREGPLQGGGLAQRCPAGTQDAARDPCSSHQRPEGALLQPAPASRPPQGPAWSHPHPGCGPPTGRGRAPVLRSFAAVVLRSLPVSYAAELCARWKARPSRPKCPQTHSLHLKTLPKASNE